MIVGCAPAMLISYSRLRKMNLIIQSGVNLLLEPTHLYMTVCTISSKHGRMH